MKHFYIVIIAKLKIIVRMVSLLIDVLYAQKFGTYIIASSSVEKFDIFVNGY